LGFFECAEDPAAAAALFSAVETWARRKGMAFVRGPLNPSTNYELGLLVEGFDYPPTLMMAYNPPYYSGLVESCGFAKEKDLFAFLIDGDYRLPEWMDRLAGRIARKKGIHIRPFRLKDEDAEFARIKEIYNDSWSANWGFVPLSDGEMRDFQKSVMTFADPDLAFFIYYEDEPAAVCVIFPDINPLLKRLNGRIGLLGPLKVLLYRREITGLRCLMFGIKDKYRQLESPCWPSTTSLRLCGKRKNTVLWNWLDPGGQRVCQHPGRGGGRKTLQEISHIQEIPLHFRIMRTSGRVVEV